MFECEACNWFQCQNCASGKQLLSCCTPAMFKEDEKEVKVPRAATAAKWNVASQEVPEPPVHEVPADTPEEQLVVRMVGLEWKALVSMYLYHRVGCCADGGWDVAAQVAAKSQLVQL